jgi:hypothetical protein
MSQLICDRRLCSLSTVSSVCRLRSLVGLTLHPRDTRSLACNHAILGVCLCQDRPLGCNVEHLAVWVPPSDLHCCDQSRSSGWSHTCATHRLSLSLRLGCLLVLVDGLHRPRTLVVLFFELNRFLRLNRAPLSLRHFHLPLSSVHPFLYCC